MKISAKNITFFLLTAIALGSIGTLAYLKHGADKQLSEAQRQYDLLAVDAAALKADLAAKTENYERTLAATQDVAREESKRREEAERKIQEKNRQLAALESRQREAEREHEEDIAALPTLDDQQLAERSVHELAPFVRDNTSLIEAIGPELFQVNRPYVLAATTAATEATFLRSAATTYESTIRLWMEKHRQQETISNSFAIELTATRKTVNACEKALIAQRAVTENADQRLEARAKQVSALGRKLTLQRIKTWGGTAAGIAVGVMVGKLVK